MDIPLMQPARMNEIQLIRHATVAIRLGNACLLVDPMLAEKDTLDPVQQAGNAIRIPMIGLPFGEAGLQRLVQEADAVVVTHLHRDHWDAKAQEIIPKDKILFCQPGDEQHLARQGFTQVRPVEESLQWNGVTLHRTGGRHGSGETGKKMGPVSGFVFAWHQLKIYLAGDTIWCKEVEDALAKFQPDYAIVNAGGAQFLAGGPITMTIEDIRQIGLHAPGMDVIAVHMDAVNHCRFGKEDLRQAIEAGQLSPRVRVPQEGERIPLPLREAGTD